MTARRRPVFLFIALCTLHLAGTGCSASRFSEVGPRRVPEVPRHLKDARFRVARVENEGSIPGYPGAWNLPSFGAQVGYVSGGIRRGTVEILPEQLDAAFSGRHPELHSASGTPLFVHVDGTWLDAPATGRIKVSLYLSDGARGPVVEKKTRGDSLFVPDFHSGSPLHEATLRIVADAVAEAICALPEGTFVSDAGAVPLSADEAATLRHLDGLVVKTFRIAPDGTETVMEHAFRTALETTNAVPVVRSQRYDSRTLKGAVVADLEGCDEALARYFLVSRLIPQICATKGAVADFGKDFAPGAVFRITKETTDGTLLSIEFVQIQ